MGVVKVKDIIPALLTILFLGLCLHFAQKAQEGPWHVAGTQLWEKKEWHKLRALGENLNRVGKEDVESYYLAMLASEQMEDSQAAKIFASRLSETRALNWKLEKHLAKSYRPSTLRKRVALFRTRLVFAVTAILFVVMILSLRKKESYKLGPALISSAGILVLLL